MTASAAPGVLVSVIIKALNEERRIAACIESALQATAGLPAEIILVDSLSDDRTVAIASAYPVRIVQFARREDRGCGAAVELGWRHARGEHVYVLDADMQLQPGFLQAALAYLAQNPSVAGVAGKLVDTRQLNAADMQRTRQAVALTQPITVPELGGGGLYRRSAIEAVGYLAHPALHAYEEAELGCRLRAKGFGLVRLATESVVHEGHAESNRAMVARLWRNGRLKAAGVLLRTSFGQPWFSFALHKLSHIAVTLALQLVTLLLIIAALFLRGGIWIIALAVGMWTVFFLCLALKHHSIGLAAWRVYFWSHSAIALIAGAIARPSNPLANIGSREITRS